MTRAVLGDKAPSLTPPGPVGFVVAHEVPHAFGAEITRITLTQATKFALCGVGYIAVPPLRSLGPRCNKDKGPRRERMLRPAAVRAMPKP